MRVKEPEEIFPVVDEHDQPVGTAERRVVHAQHLRHRSAHVLVFNSAGQLLIQQRAATKDSYPLYWDVSVGGHVAPNEAYEEAAHRELREELGLDGPLHFLRKTPASELSSWEFTCLYTLETDQPPQPNPAEIETCQFVEPSILLDEILSRRRLATPGLVSALSFHPDRQEADSGQES